MSGPTRRRVACQVDLEVKERASLAVQVTAARVAGARLDERLWVTVDGEAVDADELAEERGGRLHHVVVPPGRASIAYEASVDLPAEPPPEPDDPGERFRYLRPSRYCPSDRLAGWAAGELGTRGLEGPELVQAVVGWVERRLDYVLGSSGPLDDASDTLLAGQGVCRDYAHLAVATCRALDVPARLAAVYAPGLSPMDFHAVCEAHVAGAWHVFDATRLAPRSAMVRITTGRDAADTAFLSSYGGEVQLVATQITAVVDGELPGDDPTALVRLA